MNQICPLILHYADEDLSTSQIFLSDLSYRYSLVFGSDFIPGGDFKRLPRILGPFAQVELLDCYCDADRVTVAKIEMEIKGISIDLAEWCAGLQICLGGRLPIGKTRQITPRHFGTVSLLYERVVQWAVQCGYLCNATIVADYQYLKIRTKLLHHTYQRTAETKYQVKMTNDVAISLPVLRDYQVPYRPSCNFCWKANSLLDEANALPVDTENIDVC
jgi:hypothetical protein